MAIRAYVLIETEVAQTRAVGAGLAGFTHPDAEVLAVDTVTGPYDVIAVLLAEDLDRLGHAVAFGVQAIPGVKRTTTCLAIRLGL